MRISEKTFELNFCAEASVLMRTRQRLIWFGLTQKQEMQLGFDACIRMNARTIVFQFKASDHYLCDGRRKFHAQYHQMRRLRILARKRSNSVFYVLPSFGNTQEFFGIIDLLSRCHLVDISNFPDPIPTPNRKSNYHNIYLSADHTSVEVRSEPFHLNNIQNAKDFFIGLINKSRHTIRREDQISERENTLNFIFGSDFRPFVLHEDVGIPAQDLHAALFELLGERRSGMFALGIIPEKA